MYKILIYFASDILSKYIYPHKLLYRTCSSVFKQHSNGRKHHRHCVKKRFFAKNFQTLENDIEDLIEERRRFLNLNDFEFVSLLNIVNPKLKAFLEPENLAKILPRSFTVHKQWTFKRRTLHLLRELMKLNTDVHSEIEKLVQQVELYPDVPHITEDDLAPILRVLSVVRTPHLKLVKKYLTPRRLVKLLPGNFDIRKTANATVALHDIAILLNVTLGSAKSRKLKVGLETLISELGRRSFNVIPKEDENSTRIKKKTKWVIRQPLTDVKVPVNKIHVKYKIIRQGNATKSHDDTNRRMKLNSFTSANIPIISEKQIIKSSPVLYKNATSSNVDLIQQTRPDSYLLGNSSITFKKRITIPSPVSSSEKLSSEESSKKSRHHHRIHYKLKNRRIADPNFTVDVEYDYSDKDASLVKMLQNNDTFSLIKKIMTGEMDAQANAAKNNSSRKETKST